MVQALVARGYDVNSRNTPIAMDIYHLAPGKVSHMIMITPLAFSLIYDSFGRNEKRQLDLAKEFLEAGADCQAKIEFKFHFSSATSFEMTVLEFCVRFRSAPFVRLLLQYGAYQSVIPKRGWDLLRLAKVRGDQAIVQELEDYGLQQMPFPNMNMVKGTTILASNVLVSPLKVPYQNMFSGVDLAPIFREVLTQ